MHIEIDFEFLKNTNKSNNIHGKTAFTNDILWISIIAYIILPPILNKHCKRCKLVKITKIAYIGESPIHKSRNFSKFQKRFKYCTSESHLFYSVRQAKHQLETDSIPRSAMKSANNQFLLNFYSLYANLNFQKYCKTVIFSLKHKIQHLLVGFSSKSRKNP